MHTLSSTQMDRVQNALRQMDEYGFFVADANTGMDIEDFFKYLYGSTATTTDTVIVGPTNTRKSYHVFEHPLLMATLQNWTSIDTIRNFCFHHQFWYRIFRTNETFVYLPLSHRTAVAIHLLLSFPVSNSKCLTNWCIPYTGLRYCKCKCNDYKHQQMTFDRDTYVVRASSLWTMATGREEWFTYHPQAWSMYPRRSSKLPNADSRFGHQYWNAASHRAFWDDMFARLNAVNDLYLDFQVFGIVPVDIFADVAGKHRIPPHAIKQMAEEIVPSDGGDVTHLRIEKRWKSQTHKYRQKQTEPEQNTAKSKQNDVCPQGLLRHIVAVTLLSSRTPVHGYRHRGLLLPYGGVKRMANASFRCANVYQWVATNTLVLSTTQAKGSPPYELRIQHGSPERVDIRSVDQCIQHLTAWLLSMRNNYYQRVLFLGSGTTFCATLCVNVVFHDTQETHGILLAFLLAMNPLCLFDETHSMATAAMIAAFSDNRSCTIEALQKCIVWHRFCWDMVFPEQSGAYFDMCKIVSTLVLNHHSAILKNDEPDGDNNDAPLHKHCDESRIPVRKVSRTYTQVAKELCRINEQQIKRARMYKMGSATNMQKYIAKKNRIAQVNRILR